jgi:hypothetical protein
VKTSEKHRHGQALLAMSVLAFWGRMDRAEVLKQDFLLFERP